MQNKGSLSSLCLTFLHFHFVFFHTRPFNPASMSLARTMATFSPIAVFSVMSTEVSDVMSNTGLLSFSSRMVIETC